MDFVWHDGGRSASGFVGLAGDCATRALAIATGAAYRNVYDELGRASLKSPRNGVQIDIVSSYLGARGWRRSDGRDQDFSFGDLPKGIVIVHLGKENQRSRHLCTLIDLVVYDTWNAADDDYIVHAYWTPPDVRGDSKLPLIGVQRRIDREQELTQREFDKVMKLLRALDNTASNRASTEGEKRNALRMMQSLMLRHNLTRADITDDDDVTHVQFTRIACPVNGRRACGWEKSLAWYVTRHILPSVQWYRSTRGHRTLFWFYGPLSDVQNAIALFRELLLAIATAAHLQYGSHMRGSGASYAEGYVAGLPRTASDGPGQGTQVISERALIQTRMIALHAAAKDWLNLECDIRLSSSTGYGRYLQDGDAKNRGKQHGAQHNVTVPSHPRRIEHRDL